MTTAVLKAGRLKPEARLGQAISEFQSDLCDSQKAQFRSHQTQASTTPLEIRDVMRLTAEINRCRPHERCFGPRLTNVLQAVQQFAALGDIVLGGTQNLLACGIWSLVRMTLLSVVKYSTYFERLSSILMAVGRSAPRYQAMGIIYPKSERLRSYMLEYFIILVRLCHHVLRLSQKSTLAKWVSSLSDTALDSFQADLEVWATSIKEEMQALMTQQITDDSALNTWFRSHVGRQFDTISHSRRLRARQRLLDACSSYDYVTPWKQIRRLGNTTILSQLPEYKAWKTRKYSCTLICKGKLGSGKSVLLANVVDDLILETVAQTTIAYYFCQHDRQDSLKARTIIGSLARQLLHPVPYLEGGDNVSPDGLSLDIDSLVSFLEHNIRQQSYFILDGLDHCADYEIKMVLSTLRKLQSTFPLSVCVSLRSTALDLGFSVLETLSMVGEFSMPQRHPDLDQYINSELQRCVATGALVIGEPSLILEIQNALSQGAQGMFLWVVLQIKALCLQRTDAALRRAISRIPSDLSKTYKIIMNNAKQTGEDYQDRIMNLVISACRPLTIDEMREALAVLPGHKIWDPQRMPNNMYTTLSCCGGLLTVDEESLTVRMIHHSVGTFLRDMEGVTPDSRHISAQHDMADIIMTFMSYDMFSKQVSTMRAPEISAQSVTSSVISSTSQSLGQSQRLVLKLLGVRKGLDRDIGHTLMEGMGDFHSDIAAPLAFYDYASTWWQEHIWQIGFSTPESTFLIQNLLSVVEPDRADSHRRTPLYYAAEAGEDEIVDLLLARGAGDIPDCCQKTPLMRAIQMNYASIVDTILSSGVALPNAVDDAQVTPLLLAIKKENSHIIARLLRHPCIEVNCQDATGRTPLAWAARNRFSRGVRQLIGHTKIAIEVPDNTGQTPLHAAAFQDDPDIMSDLLGTGRISDVNARDHFGRTPLWLSSANGGLTSVRLLTSVEGIDLNSVANDSATPLWIAASHGHIEVVSYLLQFQQVDLSHMNRDGYTPLTIAASNGLGEIVSALLSSGKADLSYDFPKINPLWLATDLGHTEYVRALSVSKRFQEMHTANQAGQTPLWVAASDGQAGIVRILVAIGGIDLDCCDNSSETPLFAASRNGHADVIRILGHCPIVDVNSKGTDGLIPLAIAAKNGHSGAVSALLELTRLDANAEDIAGATALWHAIENGHDEVVRILVKAGGVSVRPYKQSVVCKNCAGRVCPPRFSTPY